MFAKADIAVLLVDKKYFASEMCNFEFNLVDARRGECVPMLVHLDDTAFTHALADVQAVLTPPVLDDQGHTDQEKVPALVQLIIEHMKPHLERMKARIAKPSSPAQRVDQEFPLDVPQQAVALAPSTASPNPAEPAAAST